MKSYYNFAPLGLRLVTGTGFIVHGWAKISRGTDGFERLLTLIDIPFAHVSAKATPYIELLGGLAILLGIFVVFVSVPLIVTMLVAMFTIHFKYGFSAVKTIGLTADGPVFGPPGYEVNLLYIACLISLLITGPGKYSFDKLIARRKKRNEFRSRELNFKQ